MASHSTGTRASNRAVGAASTRAGGATSTRAGSDRARGVLAAPRHWVVPVIVLWVLTFGLGFAVRGATGLLDAQLGLDRLLNAAHTPVADAVAIALDSLDRIPVVGACLVVLVVVGGLLRGWLRAIGAGVASGAGWLFCLVPKQLVHETRPAADTLAHHVDAGRATLSYPSGHTVFAVTLVVAVLALTTSAGQRWVVGVVGAVFVLVVAWARLYVGAHWPTDVLGALLAGVAGALLVIGVWNAVVPRVLDRR
ncbi:phosphatase PAP2 family protein [Curtobacterium sp. Leaf261]|uniref:phosphatase PAP2 family protein n=1 Tax=Curtobacterium sp. Leaf261 TaxID=1736311 RepID=UPI0009E9BCAA|nr:phosphatase PAP2 family protein [Curtobacterium sp. Leaf261]